MSSSTFQNSVLWKNNAINSEQGHFSRSENFIAETAPFQQVRAF